MSATVRRFDASDLLLQPLPPAATTAFAALLVCAGAVYCQGHAWVGAEPVAASTSFVWAACALGPWVFAFEALKRFGRTPLRVAAVILGAWLASIVMSVALLGPASPARVAFHRLPFVGLGLFVALAVRRPPSPPRPTAAAPIELPFSIQDIDFIQSAGNYVHIHRSDRTEVHRITMKAVAAGLDQNFCRIHRSSIINVSRIAEVEQGSAGPIRVRLQSGHLLDVGPRYRSALAHHG